MENNETAKGLKLWWTAIRPYSFPASIMPVIYGSLLAVLLSDGLKFNYVDFIICIFGSVLVHIGSNLINDIYDYQKGIDKEDKEVGIPHGGSLVLSKKLMNPSTMMKGAIFSLFLAGLSGIYLMFNAGIWVLYLMILGFIMAVFYTAKPLQLKYFAFGDIMVFLSFGSGMTLGAYIVQTHQFSFIPIILSIPFGLLIIAILHSNNIRDVKFDGRFGVKTVAIILGEKLSRYYYYVLIIGSYVSIVAFVVFGLLPVFALLNLITLPAGIKLIRMLNNLPEGGQERWEYGTRHNVMTAQFNTQFGVTLMVGLILALVF